MKQKPYKWIVSKREYVAMILEKLLYTCGACLLRLTTCLCMLAALWCYMLIIKIGGSMLGLWVPRRLLHMDETAQVIALIGLLIALCYATFRSNEEAEWVEDRGRKPIMALPHTRAITTDLPDPTSLIRASQEPVQSQETVLLRAAREGVQTREEQLLRASAGRQE